MAVRALARSAKGRQGQWVGALSALARSCSGPRHITYFATIHVAGQGKVAHGPTQVLGDRFGGRTLGWGSGPWGQCAGPHQDGHISGICWARRGSGPPCVRGSGPIIMACIGPHTQGQNQAVRHAWHGCGTRGGTRGPSGRRGGRSIMVYPR